MDAHDLFHQLTRGVKFNKKPTQTAPIKPKSPTSIKAETSATSQKQNNDNFYDGSSSSKIDLLIETNDSDFKYLDSESEGEGDVKSEVVEPKRKKIEPSNFEKDRIQQEEDASQLREEHGITVFGRQIPPPIKSFTDLRTIFNIPKQLVTNIEACKYPKPTPIQMQAIPIMLKGRPLMACAPTGSGKTVAFLTPIINDLRVPKKDGFRAIILAPTRELSQQIYRECVRLSERTALKIHIISKGNQAQQKLHQRKYDILISTPNRVRYLLKMEPPVINLRHIEWFVIDEADRLMEDGKHNFKEQIDDILAACTNPSKKLALFSATYTVPVARWALRNLKNLARVTIGQQNSAPDLVHQELLFVGSESGKLLAMRNLVHQGLKPPVLVFVQSKDRAKQLFEELLFDGINVDVIHADRTQQQRDNCVRAFREGNIWVLICTELMGRGIDFKGVNLVINYDFPPTTISYIHRIGRTGRAGRAGKAITFYTQEDTPMLKSIAYIVKNSGGEVPDFIMNMKNTSKLEKRKLASRAPSREDISTQLKPEKKREEVPAVNEQQTNVKHDGNANVNDDRNEMWAYKTLQRVVQIKNAKKLEEKKKDSKNKTVTKAKTKSKTKTRGVTKSKKKVKK